MSVREASSAENSISASRPSCSRPCRTQLTASASAVSRSTRSLCLRWMSLVAMNTCRCGRSATLIASMARCGSPSLQRARAATAIPPRVSWAIRLTASKSPGEADGKPASMTSTFRRTSWRATSSFSATVRPAPGRLLAVAQGRIEDPDAARRHERAGGTGYWRGHREAPGVVAAAWAEPACTSTGFRNGIWAAQPRPDPLDEVVVVGRAEALELGPAGVVLGDPAVRERPVLDVLEHGLHRHPDVVVDDPRPADVVAVLGRVADAEAHEVQAAAVHEVDDELELVHRLEVRELGLVAGLDERLERHLHERRRAAAQHGLLAEQVRLGLLGEGRLEDAGAGVAEGPGVGHRPVAGGAGLVAVDGEQGGHAATGLVDAADEVARALRRDHPDVDDARRVDPAEVDVEAVGEHQQVAGPQVRGDRRVVDGLLGRVRDQDHDHVGGPNGLVDVHDPQAGIGDELAALRRRREAHDDIDAALVEVERMRVALAAVADDRHGLAGQRGRVRVVVVVHRRRHRLIASSMEPEPRAITTAPVRTNSLMP